jgi:hypothetical protein
MAAIGAWDRHDDGSYISVPISWRDLDRARGGVPGTARATENATVANPVATWRDAGPGYGSTLAHPGCCGWSRLYRCPWPLRASFRIDHGYNPPGTVAISRNRWHSAQEQAVMALQGKRTLREPSPYLTQHVSRWRRSACKSRAAQRDAIPNVRGRLLVDIDRAVEPALTERIGLPDIAAALLPNKAQHLLNPALHHHERCHHVRAATFASQAARSPM